jgi:hypothetical protein
MLLSAYSVLLFTLLQYISNNLFKFSIYCKILILKPTRCTIFVPYFGKELYMFRTDLLSIIRSLNTVFTAIGICHATCVGLSASEVELELPS